MNKLGRTSVAVGALTLGSLFAGVSSEAVAGKFTLAHPGNQDHIYSQMSERFLDSLDAAGAEHLKVNYQPGGTLGDWTSIFEQTMQGAIPMSLTWGASEFDGRLDVLYLAYVVDNWAKATDVYGPGGQMLDVYNEILADLGLVAIGTIPTDFGSIAIRKGVNKLPLNYPEDAAGIKIRVPGLPVAVERFNALGFSPVPMPLSEVHTALQLGTVDARTFAPPVEVWQMRDVLESYILTRDYFEHGFWLVNKDWWDGLSQEDQTLINTAANDAISWAWQDAEKLGEEFLQKIKGAGINVVELSPEQLANTKRLVYENEWPFMEEKLGKKIMADLRAISGQ
ncbi:TRAP transporter substrate-binding protein DctP [Amphritea spongicola]|nr:TRAP transporter substrate-binding protein DctP [Aliamphritea spongicola]